MVPAFHPRLQLALWTPKGSSLVYVFENDIYYLPKVTGDAIRLTYTGSEHTVFNGVPDWVYEGK